MKLAIRQDEEAGVIRAYFAQLDDSQRFEVATLHLELTRKCPGLFDAWKEALTEALRQALRETGHVVKHVVEYRPKDKN